MFILKTEAVASPQTGAHLCTYLGKHPIDGTMFVPLCVY